jgi:hypothetical protein
MNAPKHHFIQFVCLMVLCGAIVLQGFTHVIKVKPLYNYQNQPITYSLDKVALSFKTIRNGDYQLYLAEKAWQNTGFRETFCRSYNQLTYSFGQTVNPHVLKGHHKELYILGNLNDVNGETLMEEYGSVENAQAEARNNVEATLALIDTLKQHGTDFLFVFCPTKPAVYPEYVPEPYKDNFFDFSLVDYYIELFKENEIPYIDFYNYFIAIKEGSKYPLYTRYGGHWAASTMPLVTDSILRKMEVVSGFKLPSISCIDLNLTRRYSRQDGELESSLNLLFPLAKPKLPKPLMALTDTLGVDRPNLVIVADGYFVPLEKTGFLDAFSTWNYLKYNDYIVSSDSDISWKKISEYPEARQLLEDADIVLAMYTSSYLFDYMNGFTQTAQEILSRTN